jgi:hypothetical protein
MLRPVPIAINPLETGRHPAHTRTMPDNARRRPEQQLQAAIFRHIQVRGKPGIVAWHTPNGGKRSKAEAAIFKSLGVLAGIPDVLVLDTDGQLYGLELKAAGGRTTPRQNATLERLAVAVGLDAALKQLERWELLRPDHFTRE